MLCAGGLAHAPQTWARSWRHHMQGHSKGCRERFNQLIEAEAGPQTEAAPESGATRRMEVGQAEVIPDGEVPGEADTYEVLFEGVKWPLAVVRVRRRRVLQGACPWARP